MKRSPANNSERRSVDSDGINIGGLIEGGQRLYRCLSERTPAARGRNIVP